MITDRKGEVSTREVFKEVPSIDGPGKYMFAEDPNREQVYRIGYHGEENNHEIKGTYTPHFDLDIPDHFREKFPNIWTVAFHPATLFDGKYTPARLEYFPKWADWGYSNKSFIGLYGEIYEISRGGNSSNGYGNWGFAIEDLGNLSVVENKLEIAQLEDRDGKIRIHLSGTVPHFRRETGKSWQGWVYVEGEKPGILVRSAIEYLNDVKTVSAFPLWEATQTPV